jgi:thiol-disulfide isomerase/thioredoxin
MMTMKAKTTTLALSLVGILLFASLLLGQEAQAENSEATGVLSEVPSWMRFELTDVLTGQTFSFSGFLGKPILLESFAVWCPTCLKQQQEMDKLLESDGDTIIHISLDTDPNEDEEQVRAHAQRHGFEWYFAISPIALTQALIDEFGLTVVSAPRAPVILIETDGSSRLLKGGLKSAEFLAAEIGKGND